MSDHDQDPGASAADDELDDRASGLLDGQGPGPSGGADSVGGPELAARVAAFDQVRSSLADVPEPPPGALDDAVAAALAAYDEERRQEAAASAAEVPRLPPRRARWLAPLGAAAAAAVLAGVAALAAGRDDGSGDAASGARATVEADAPAAALMEEPSTAEAEVGTLAEGGAGGRGAPGAPPAGSTPAGQAAEAAAPHLGSFATLEALARALDVPAADDGTATMGAPPPVPPPAPTTTAAGPPPPGTAPGAGERPVPPPTPSEEATGAACPADGAHLGTAEVGGRFVHVVRRPDGALAAFGRDCTLLAETAPAVAPTTAP